VVGQQPKEAKSRKPKRRSAGPPPAVLVLLFVECVAVVVLRSRGVSWSELLKSAALPIALTMAMFTP
jgi:hypothetical protein